MKTQVRYLRFYILVINDKYWLLSWQVLKIIFPISQVTKIKAERLNALCSATGKEHGRTMSSGISWQSTQNWILQKFGSLASEETGGIYWLKGQGNAQRCLDIKLSIKKKNLRKISRYAVYAVPTGGIEEWLWSQDFRDVGPQAGDPGLRAHCLMSFDKVSHCFTGTVGSEIAMCRYRRAKSGMLYLGRLRLI